MTASAFHGIWSAGLPSPVVGMETMPLSRHVLDLTAFSHMRWGFDETRTATYLDSTVASAEDLCANASLNNGHSVRNTEQKLVWSQFSHIRLLMGFRLPFVYLIFGLFIHVIFFLHFFLLTFQYISLFLVLAGRNASMQAASKLDDTFTAISCINTTNMYKTIIAIARQRAAGFWGKIYGWHDHAAPSLRIQTCCRQGRRRVLDSFPLELALV